MQIFVNNEKEQVEFESTTYLPTSGWMLDGANLAGDSGAAGGEALKGVLVVGGDRGRCFSMTCDWNASMETHESPQAEQYMTGGGGAFLAASGETARGGWLISGCAGSVSTGVDFRGGGASSTPAPSGSPSLSSPSSSSSSSATSENSSDDSLIVRSLNLASATT
jgi:hypothetical protein